VSSIRFDKTLIEKLKEILLRFWLQFAFVCVELSVELSSAGPLVVIFITSLF
jgi:hypothetical protein